ncbi:MAG: hypothetical protein Q8Q45_02680 [Methylococcaceae bacterium]|nr:hypothetical protein [Methylococcaceae bacterium]MDP3931231.1 hypothetical protein [Methylococcaceae bacterium]MDZ4156109.1 hypothetical protein [Methylococcales bacterium]
MARYILAKGGPGIPARLPVNVSGPSSVARASNYIQVGSYSTNTVSSLNINNGGRVEVLDGSPYGGADIGISTLAGTAEVKVSGAASTLAAEQIRIGGSRTIAGYTSTGAPVADIDWDTLSVGQQVADENGNLVYDRNGNPVLAVEHPLYGEVVPSTYLNGNSIYNKSTGTLIVENGAQVDTQTINVSVNNPNTPTYNNQGAVLTVRNGGVVTGDVNVYEDGLLNGNGSILGNVLVDGGTLASGNSPGTITIGGDLELRSGQLEIEIGGTGVNEFDVVHVLGDVTAADGFDVKVKLLNNFIPQEGQSFEFLDIDGLANFDFSLLNLILDENVQNGFNISFDNGALSLVSTSAVPVPASIWLFGSGIIGLLRFKGRKN